ncbi:MAG: amidohydrolase family protein [Coriobacteriales bacterium]|nr:amidohydrolase family protein [Coriobacteriales bacterium]
MLLCARYILPVSQPHIENGAVLVRDGRIADVGYASDLKMRYPEEKTRDFGLAAIMPGFVDLHTHLEYTALRGASPDVPYAPYKNAVDEKAMLLSRQDWDDSALLGGLEAVASGITTVADITSTGASAAAVNAIGLRGMIYREAETMEKARIKRTIERADEDIHAWREAYDPQRITVGIGANTLYRCHPDLLAAIADYGSDGTPVAVHVACSQEESDFVRYGSSPFSVHNHELERGYGIDMPPWLPTGVSPVRYVLNWGILDAPNVLAIHCVHVDDEDIEMLAERDVAIAFCPRCNAKLGMGVAPVGKYLKAGLRVGLGTDSPAASDSMDMIDEMRIGMLIQRSFGDKRNFITTNQMVRMATLDGARALKMEDRIGSLEPGKLADVIAIDLSNSHQAPTHFPDSAIVHTANQDNVIMTMVGGKILYENGTHKHRVDPGRVKARAEEMRLKLR